VTSSDGGSIKLYVDGINVATKTLNFSTPAGGQFWIGKIKSPYAPVQFYGLIDEVSVYDRALSDSEIQLLSAK
jgi:Concanavalin A-like lectin/glucanases superfamily